jgi:hypothetical protein
MNRSGTSTCPIHARNAFSSPTDLEDGEGSRRATVPGRGIARCPTRRAVAAGHVVLDEEGSCLLDIADDAPSWGTGASSPWRESETFRDRVEIIRLDRPGEQSVALRDPLREPWPPGGSRSDRWQ